MININELEAALRDMNLMEPDEIKRAIEYRKKKIDKEFDEPEGRQIQAQASEIVQKRYCTMIFSLIVIVILIGFSYTSIKAWQSHHNNQSLSN